MESVGRWSKNDLKREKKLMGAEFGRKLFEIEEKCKVEFDLERMSKKEEESEER